MRGKQEGKAASREEGKDQQWAQEGRRARQDEEETDRRFLSGPPYASVLPLSGWEDTKQGGRCEDCRSRRQAAGEGQTRPDSPSPNQLEEPAPQPPPQVSTNLIRPCPLPAPPTRGTKDSGAKSDKK